jgi:hypothetical protein
MYKKNRSVSRTKKVSFIYQALRAKIQLQVKRLKVLTPSVRRVTVVAFLSIKSVT